MEWEKRLREGERGKALSFFLHTEVSVGCKEVSSQEKN